MKGWTGHRGRRERWAWSWGRGAVGGVAGLAPREVSGQSPEVPAHWMPQGPRVGTALLGMPSGCVAGREKGGAQTGQVEWPLVGVWSRLPGDVRTYVVAGQRGLRAASLP